MGQQSELANRRVERAAHPIIEVNVIKIGRRLAGDRVADGGIEQLAVGVLDVDLFLFGTEHQLAVLQRADDDFRPRTATGDDLADAGQRFVEIVRGEVRNGVVERCGMRVRTAQGETEG